MPTMRHSMRWGLAARRFRTAAKSGTAHDAIARGRRRHNAMTFEYISRVVMFGLILITHTNSF